MGHPQFVCCLHCFIPSLAKDGQDPSASLRAGSPVPTIECIGPSVGRSFALRRTCASSGLVGRTLLSAAVGVGLQTVEVKTGSKAADRSVRPTLRYEQEG